jgi:hypothetical protein
MMPAGDRAALANAGLVDGHVDVRPIGVPDIIMVQKVQLFNMERREVLLLGFRPKRSELRPGVRGGNGVTGHPPFEWDASREGDQVAVGQIKAVRLRVRVAYVPNDLGFHFEQDGRLGPLHSYVDRAQPRAVDAREGIDLPSGVEHDYAGRYSDSFGLGLRRSNQNVGLPRRDLLGCSPF